MPVTSPTEFYELQKRGMAARVYVGRHRAYDGRGEGDLYVAQTFDAEHRDLTPFITYATPTRVLKLLDVIEKANWNGEFGKSIPTVARLHEIEPGLKLWKKRENA